MAESHNLGEKGEDIAAEYLGLSGYKILSRNFKWGKNEIDIIAENRDFIVFVEVKTRSADYYVHPSEAVTPDKQRCIIRAADGYINKFNILKESRFDVITVIQKGDKYETDHIESAFYPTLR